MTFDKKESESSPFLVNLPIEHLYQMLYYVVSWLLKLVFVLRMYWAGLHVQEERGTWISRW